MKVTVLNQEHNIKLYDWSDVITEQHNKEICKTAQAMFDNGEYREEYPMYTTSGDPFEDKPDEIWKTMKHTFHASCADYIGRPFKVQSTQSRVTSMMYDPEIDYTEMWHDHSLEEDTGLAITGVWFLSAPEELIETGRAGTEFAYNWPDISETSFVGPYKLSWVIFPNYLWHAPGQLHATVPRFVLSADIEYMLL
jgi:hypothetical protein